MADENKAFALQGIVRNATKIGVQDGQSEDLVNLRYKDGAWRSAGDGKKVGCYTGGNLPYDMVNNYKYVFVHTNVYRHLLGVLYGSTTDDNGKSVGTLYWFANIVEDDKFENFVPKPLCEVHGEINVSQTGHLITVIDEYDDFEYFVFKKNTNEYKEVNVDVNGLETDRGIYPFGRVHFNLHKEDSYIETMSKLAKPTVGDYWFDAGFDIRESVVCAEFNRDNAHSKMVTMYGNAENDNFFTRPFLAIAAIEMYDGTFLYASNPVLLNPSENALLAHSLFGNKVYTNAYNDGHWKDDDVVNVKHSNAEGSYWPNYNDYLYVPKCKLYLYDEDNYGAGSSKVVHVEDVYVGGGERNEDVSGDKDVSVNNSIIIAKNKPTFGAGMHVNEALGGLVNVENGGITIGEDDGVRPTFEMSRFSLSVSFDNENVIFDNKDLFKSISIFITPEVNIFEVGEDSRKKGQIVCKYQGWNNDTYACYAPMSRTIDAIKYDLIHSNFYLLKQYDASQVSSIYSMPIINLNTPECEGVLKAINSGAESLVLNTESLSRTTYMPKYSYSYNGRLHIANYETKQFHGYPIDLFHLNNHKVKYEDGGSVHGQLKNIVLDEDEYYQHERLKHDFSDNAPDKQEYASTMISKGKCFAYVVVEIDTGDGVQKVVRIVEPFNTEGKADGFYEDLDAMLCFPDYRAKKMTIMVSHYNDTRLGTIVLKRTFDLTPHPYLNISYYINSSLSPISISILNGWTNGSSIKPLEQNTTEFFPNGLKVSSTDNPMYFPVENTYQVGSAEIVAMCSNAVAVGTGQTGSAPLYVFCKDGIYALFVDSSGNMAYTNARVIARDVCNNARSVTPIDEGVVFSTDRGLMLIAGEQVQEIGQPLEGDWCKFTTSSNTDEYNTVLCRAYGVAVGSESVVNKLADLGSTTMVNEDFLSYLKGSVINYNHNERELMVTNPSKSYSFIMDRNGQWSRVNYSADEYVDNYPTSYRVKDKKFYQVDKQSDADNKVFVLSKALKLDSIGFKELHRFVVRGYFETLASKYLGLYVYGSYDGRRWSLLGIQEKTGKFTDIGCLVERTDCKFFRYALAGQITKDSRLDYIELSSKQSRLSTKIR